MKVLVCKNKHCRSKETDKVLDKLKTIEGIEFDYSSCMDLCDYGPNVITLPNLKLYGAVTEDDIEELIKGNREELLHPKDRIFDELAIQELRDDPMHKRTIKLFRYQLEKQLDLSVEGLRLFLSTFKDKYDVVDVLFTDHLKIAMFGTAKGPNLEKLIHYLGKRETIRLFDNYLSNAHQRA